MADLVYTRNYPGGWKPIPNLNPVPGGTPVGVNQLENYETTLTALVAAVNANTHGIAALALVDNLDGTATLGS